jgi:hypothetical protein
MASKHLPVILLVGFLLIKSIKGRAESIEFAGYGEEKLSKVVVVGNVFCDTCLKHQFSRESSHVITGALVALECRINRKTTASVTVGESDEYGDFSVEVPSLFHPEERMNRCSVRLLKSSEGSCNTPSTTVASKLTFISNSNGVRTYTAGSLSYRSQDIPRLCDKKAVQQG